MVRQELLDSLTQFDALLSPVAPTPAYKFGEKLEDPIAMYKGDLMTVGLNLAGEGFCAVKCIAGVLGVAKLLPLQWAYRRAAPASLHLTSSSIECTVPTCQYRQSLLGCTEAFG